MQIWIAYAALSANQIQVLFKCTHVSARAQNQPNRENSPKSPDPFPPLRVASGDETSYEAALKIIEPFLVNTVVYLACPNDCILFTKEYSDLVQCPKCNANRFKPNTCIPVQKFTYLTIGPRLIRLYGTDKVAQILQAHSFPVDDHTVYGIQHSKCWESAYHEHGVFNGDSRGIALSFCTNGVNPFSHQKCKYSMWLIVMTILNYPQEICNKIGNLMLLGIVPGNRTKEPDNLNPYIEVIVDELSVLSNASVFDSHQNAWFQLKVEILLHVLDYPGIGKVFNVMGANVLKGCAWCEIEGTYTIIVAVDESIWHLGP